MSVLSQHIITKDLPSSGELAGIFTRIIRAVSLMSARHHQRKVLMKLDDRQLDDIGLTREEAMQEAAKPFWR